jgi:ABC-type multidrug transport system ATPase subunit
MAALIEVSGLTKRYGRKRGIIDVSFQVGEGEVFGFLGPNGAGKTTTMRLLMGLLFPDGGRARIAGLDCWRQSVDVKREVGAAVSIAHISRRSSRGSISTRPASSAITRMATSRRSA